MATSPLLWIITIITQGYLYQPDAFRASDHDPVLVGLSLGAPPVVIFGANTVPADGASLNHRPDADPCRVQQRRAQ